jgi:hypothetical protein
MFTLAGMPALSLIAGLSGPSTAEIGRSLGEEIGGRDVVVVRTGIRRICKKSKANRELK